MELRLPQTHVYALNPSIDFESAKQQALDKRVGVVAGGLGGLLSRPKPDDVELVYNEVRLESFWHISCTVRYVFERSRTFSVPITSVEVRSVTLLGQDFEVAVQQQPQQPSGQPALFQQISQQIGLSGAARSISVPGVEHCVDENRQERYLDAVNGQALQLGADYARNDKTEVHDFSELAAGEVLVERVGAENGAGADFVVFPEGGPALDVDVRLQEAEAADGNVGLNDAGFADHRLRADRCARMHSGRGSDGRRRIDGHYLV